MSQQLVLVYVQWDEELSLILLLYIPMSKEAIKMILLSIQTLQWQVVFIPFGGIVTDLVSYHTHCRKITAK